MFQRIFLGDRAIERPNPLKDLGYREIAATVPIIIFIFWIGLYPKPLLRTMDASVNNLVKIVEINSQKSTASKARGPAGPALLSLNE
jgi:NADH-quinone oxidoreductase subunit M